MTIAIRDLFQPQILLVLGGFLGLCILCSWALFRATDPRKRDDDG